MSWFPESDLAFVTTYIDKIGNCISTSFCTFCSIVGFGPSVQMASTTDQSKKSVDRYLDRRLTEHVYQLSNEGSDVEIVLFHGFQIPGPNHDPVNAYWKTWTTRNSNDCWLETLLPERLKQISNGHGREPRARVLAVSYESRLKLAGADLDGKPEGVHDAKLLMDDLIQELICTEDRRAQVGQSGVPVFLLGHDLGGILIKRFVLEVEKEEALATPGSRRQLQLHKFLESLKSIFFFATPHAGASVFDKIAEKITPGTTQHGFLHFMKVLNEHKGRDNQEFEKYRLARDHLKLARFTTGAIRATHKTDLGEFGTLEVVPEGSERLGVDTFYSYAADHFKVCQPEGTYSGPVANLANEILVALENQKTSKTVTPAPADRPGNPKLDELREKRIKFYTEDLTNDRVQCNSTTQA